MNKVTLTIRLSPRDKKELQKRAKKAKQSTSEVIRDILKGFLAKS